MVNHIKTTLEIADALLQKAKKLASEDRTTLRALVEEGLRKIFSERERKGGYRVRKATFRGKGLHRDVKEGSWERIRDLIYEGRGS
jgi:hypothetical protein